jgi:hypothetical protein
MPEFCTCGAELPPDARFCHKCGKPQREELTPEPPPNWQSEPKPTFVTNIPAPPPRPSFRNPAAVRVGFFAACLASLLCTVFAYAFVVWLVAAGFFSVYLYRRRTGQFLSVRSGARLGWITGILSFFIISVFFTISVLAISARSGGFVAAYREQISTMNMPEQNVQQALQYLQSPAGLATFFLLLFFFLFAIITSFCTVGGALGAKILDRE